MRPVAIVSAVQSDLVETFAGNEIELLLPVVRDAVSASGLARHEIGVTTASSNDFFAGQAFAFVRALDAIGAHPVIDDSHLDMDGAWALYEAWVRLQTGEVDSALVYALGKTSACRLDEVTPLQYDPYALQLLGLEPTALAAMQARVALEAGRTSRREMAAVAARAHANAVANPRLWHSDAPDEAGCAEAPVVADPLRRYDCATGCDGVAAVVLVAGERARELCEAPIWIRGLAHRVEAHYPGVRDLTAARSARLAGEAAGLPAFDPDFAELSATYSHEVPLLRDALGLGGDVAIDPSGGALVANPVMATGLVRVVEAVTRLRAGAGERAVAHAASGPCLQQNLVCLLEAA